MIYEFFWWLAIITGYPVQLLCFKTKTFYEDKSVQNKKIKGGALVITNHYSIFDFVVNMFLFLPRKLHVIASELAYRNPWISFGMRFFGGIQVDRVNKSMRFLDESIKIIKKGKIVQIFPEGRNTPDGKIHPFKPTYIMIALRAGCPIIPVVTDGNYGLFKQVHIIIGKPIEIENDKITKEEISALNDRIYEKMLELKGQLETLKNGGR